MRHPPLSPRLTLLLWVGPELLLGPRFLNWILGSYFLFRSGEVLSPRVVPLTPRVPSGSTQDYLGPSLPYATPPGPLPRTTSYMTHRKEKGCLESLKGPQSRRHMSYVHTRLRTPSPTQVDLLLNGKRFSTVPGHVQSWTKTVRSESPVE